MQTVKYFQDRFAQLCCGQRVASQSIILFPKWYRYSFEGLKLAAKGQSLLIRSIKLEGYLGYLGYLGFAQGARGMVNWDLAPGQALSDLAMHHISLLPLEQQQVMDDSPGSRILSSSAKIEHTAMRYSYFADYGIILGQALCGRHMHGVQAPSCDHAAAGQKVEERTALLQLIFPDAATVLVITSRDREKLVVDALRACHPNKLVGTSSEHEWIGSALDYIVASPQDVMNMCHGDYCAAVVVDGELEAAAAAEAIQHIERFLDFSGFYDIGGDKKLHHVRVSCVRPMPWLGICMPLSPSLLKAVHSQLPEAAACPGLGDGTFQEIVHTFARKQTNISTADLSSFVGLMPGITRNVLCGGTSLVVSATSLVGPITQLLEAFVCDVGLLDLDPGSIVVASPEDLFSFRQERGLGRSKQMVMVMVCLDERQASKDLFQAAAECAKVAFVCCSESLTEEGLRLASFAGSMSVWKARPAALTLDRVHIFVAPVESEGAKVEKLVEVWKELGTLLSIKVCVFCNSAAKVMVLQQVLSARGVPVCALHTDMQEEEMKQLKQQLDQRQLHMHTLIVTNIYECQGGMSELVMYELPSECEDFVKRCGLGRMRPSKLVINLVAGEEEQALLHRLSETGQFKAKPLPSREKLMSIRKLLRRGYM